MLELPPKLTAQRVHLTFHVSLIRAHTPNDNKRFLHHDVKSYYDFGAVDEHEWFVDEILAHHWVGQTHLEFQVHCTLGDIMWEPLTECKELEALDEYLELCGAKRPHDLLCKPNLPGRLHQSCD